MSSQRLATTPVYPGLNTQFIGVLQSQGVWSEKCLGCGDCRLAETAGICPPTRCPKRVLAGPCGGSEGGRYETAADRECAWELIYERARALGTVDRLLNQIAPPQDWSSGFDASPRTVVREDQRIARPNQKR
jgi:hypothetical protein